MKKDTVNLIHYVYGKQNVLDSSKHGTLFKFSLGYSLTRKCQD